MSLKSNIEAAIKSAMLAKEQTRLLALRSIKSLILLEATKEGSSGELSEEEEMKILNKAAKQRRDSIDIFVKQNRTDLAEKEQAELSVIEEFLPKQLTAEELEDKIKGFITQVGASGPADMGKVMGVASKALAGLADGRLISETVKRLLSQG
ncbi:MAG TPA: GatB/YqeY domain-containing protein [Catalimonadaceae bacterium]|nr:GatB/YqeY domain-containing protein [Catalimonadaceae bacterium]